LTSHRSVPHCEPQVAGAAARRTAGAGSGPWLLQHSAAAITGITPSSVRIYENGFCGPTVSLQLGELLESHKLTFSGALAERCRVAEPRAGGTRQLQAWVRRQSGECPGRDR